MSCTGFTMSGYYIYQEQNDSVSSYPSEKGFQRHANEVIRPQTPLNPDGELDTLRHGLSSRSSRRPIQFQSTKLDPPGSTETSGSKRDPGKLVTGDPSIDLDDSEEDLAFRIVIQEARKQQDKNKYEQARNKLRYDAARTPPGKNQTFFSSNRTPEPPSPVATPDITWKTVGGRYASSTKTERYPRHNYTERWTATPPKHHSFASYHRSPQPAETNYFLNRVHGHDQSPKLSFTRKEASDDYYLFMGSRGEPIPSEKREPSLSTSLETPDLTTQTSKSDQSGSSLLRDVKANPPSTASLYPTTLSKTFESLEHDASLKFLMEKVQKQQEELIRSLDFAMENEPPEVHRKDFSLLRNKVKPSSNAEIPAKPSLDSHEAEQKGKLFFDFDDERVKKSIPEAKDESIRNGVSEKSNQKEKLKENCDRDTSAVQKEHTTVKDNLHVSTSLSSYATDATEVMPPARETASSVEPLPPSLNVESFKNGKETETLHHPNHEQGDKCLLTGISLKEKPIPLHQEEHMSSIKSLLELMNTMRETIDRQEALISHLQAENSYLYNKVLMKDDTDHNSFRAKVAAMGQTVDHPFYPSSTVVEKLSKHAQLSPARYEALSSTIDSQWHQLESVRRKHGWI